MARDRRRGRHPPPPPLGRIQRVRTQPRSCAAGSPRSSTSGAANRASSSPPGTPTTSPAPATSATFESPNANSAPAPAFSSTACSKTPAYRRTRSRARRQRLTSRSRLRSPRASPQPASACEPLQPRSTSTSFRSSGRNTTSCCPGSALASAGPLISTLLDPAVRHTIDELGGYDTTRAGEIQPVPDIDLQR